MSSIGKLLGNVIMDSMRKQEERIKNGEQIITSVESIKTTAGSKTTIVVKADLDGWCEDEFTFEFINVLDLNEYDFIRKSISEAKYMIHQCEKIYKKTILTDEALINECIIEKAEDKYKVSVVIYKNEWCEKTVEIGEYIATAETIEEVAKELEVVEKNIECMQVQEARYYIEKHNKYIVEQNNTEK